MENTNSKMHKNDNSYVLSALSYLSIFLHLSFYLYWYGYLRKSQRLSMVKSIREPCYNVDQFFIGRAAFIFSKEVFDKPFDHQLLIFVIALIIAIVFFLIALILYILNIIRGIKILLKNKSLIY